MFRIGQKVVFIGKGDYLNGRARGEMIDWPRRGPIYTVRENTFYSNIPGIRLIEIVNPPFKFAEGLEEVCWAANEFRPVDDRETDISFAHEILRKATKKERA